MSIRTTLFEISKRLISYDKKLEIQKNGTDNLYTERMEAFRNNSVTAAMSANIMSQYITGKGFGLYNDVEVGGSKLIEITDDITRDLVNNRGVFISVSYDLNYNKTEFKVIPFANCRLGLKDSKEYNGKILVCKDWSKKITDKDISVVNVFNDDKKIVKSQIQAAGSVEQYKGQIFFYNMDRHFYYPLNRINTVSSDCDSEASAGVYKNELLRRGFFGKTLVVTRPLVDTEMYQRATTDEGRKELRDAESEREEFKKSIKSFVGSDEIGGALHLEMDFNSENLEDAILFKNIESNINDKLFEYTEKSVISNILMAFNNLPISLVKSPDSSLFGTSGEGLKVAKLMYQENTTKERLIVEQLINKFALGLPLFKDVSKLELIPLIETNGQSNNSEREKAQANLRGSVGGVTSLLQIQQSVSNQTTDLEAAVEIVKEIFGINEDVARKMLGTPKIKPLDDVTN